MEHRGITMKELVDATLQNVKAKIAEKLGNKRFNKVLEDNPHYEAQIRERIEELIEKHEQERRLKELETLAKLLATQFEDVLQKNKSWWIQHIEDSNEVNQNILKRLRTLELNLARFKNFSSEDRKNRDWNQIAEELGRPELKCYV